MPIDRDDTDDTDPDDLAPGFVPGRLLPRRQLPGRPSSSRATSARRASGRRRTRSQVRDPRTARRWFVLDAVFVAAAVVALVVGWASTPDDTGLAAFLTICVVLAAANALWEMRRLWPVTGWRTDDPTSTGG